MTLRLWWLRHAPTGATGAIGRTDLPADLHDRAALAAVARALPDAPLRPSALSRARMTAEAVARGRSVLPGDARLNEVDFGDWEGRDFSRIAEDRPEQSRAFWEGRGRAPGGESFADLSARIGAAMAELTEETGDVVLVAHMGAIMAALGVAGGFAPMQAMRFRIDTLSLTRMDWAAGRWSIGFVNRAATFS